MSAVELALAGAALLIGVTGAWSPCGFSMVETIGLSGDGGRRGTTIAACASFAPGAAVGGIATFGLLAGLGELVHGVGGRVAYLAAAGIALAAALAEARGARIAPQIRRQLPERWRWLLPMPVAAALYGILLGLGFTTFVLSFGVWALAGISFALGDPSTGLLIGAAFGLGRAIPVAVVAPVVDRPFGNRCIELMAERPALYRGFRIGDAVTLGLVGAALIATGTATAARTAAVRAADPSATGKALAFQRPDRSGVLRQHGQKIELPGRDPAVGGPYVAIVSGGDSIKILSRGTQDEIGSASAPDAEALAISRSWLAYLVVDQGRYVLEARRIRNPADPGAPRRIVAVSSPSEIGHPALEGTRLFYPVAHRGESMIKRRSLGSGKGGTVLSSRTASLCNPSVHGRHLLYVRTWRARQSPQATHSAPLVQSLVLKSLRHHGSGHRIYSRGSDGSLWSTAISTRRAFVTLRRSGEEKILSVHH